ncbi:MAG: hypothetical protein J6D34_09315 [Atopobiaceae bacterium]|nr:hypothetical protein [Atopobiaceae bacterium]
MGALTTMVGRTPEGAEPGDRHFVGFYGEDGGLVAVMDLICAHPRQDEARIDWFMVAADAQAEGAESGIAFWRAQGFAPTGERSEDAHGTLVTLGRNL